MTPTTTTTINNNHFISETRSEKNPEPGSPDLRGGGEFCYRESKGVSSRRGEKGEKGGGRAYAG